MLRFSSNFLFTCNYIFIGFLHGFLQLIISFVMVRGLRWLVWSPTFCVFIKDSTAASVRKLLLVQVFDWDNPTLCLKQEIYKQKELIGPKNVNLWKKNPQMYCFSSNLSLKIKWRFTSSFEYWKCTKSSSRQSSQSKLSQVFSWEQSPWTSLDVCAFSAHAHSPPLPSWRFVQVMKFLGVGWRTINQKEQYTSGKTFRVVWKRLFSTRVSFLE